MAHTRARGAHVHRQALSRVHRIGQTKPVMIYRLVTRHTVEEKIVQRAKDKMVMHKVVVGNTAQTPVSKRELDETLKFGALELFADHGPLARLTYGDEAIEKLLDRSVEDTGARGGLRVCLCDCARPRAVMCGRARVTTRGSGTQLTLMSRTRVRTSSLPSVSPPSTTSVRPRALPVRMTVVLPPLVVAAVAAAAVAAARPVRAVAARPL